MRSLAHLPKHAHPRRRAASRVESEESGLHDRLGNSGLLHALRRSGRMPPGAQPLEPDLRRHLESSFGHDFAGVRLRSDVEGDRAARAKGALAYTSGSDITVRREALASGGEGVGLLAHELAHVVQQGAAPPLDSAAGSAPRTPRPESAGAEREADAAASIVSAGGRVPPLSPTTSSVQLTKGVPGGASSDVVALATEIQIWVDSISSEYRNTPVSGTRLHDVMNEALSPVGNPRLMTEVALDPAGYVLDFGEGPSSVASARSAMEMDLDVSGGYFRSVDAVLIVAEDSAVVQAIRRGSLPVTGRAIPIDYKFGGARVNAGGEAAIEEMFGTRTIPCRPWGDLAGEVGWVQMELAMSPEPLPPLSLSSALDPITEPPAIAGETVKAQLEIPGVEGAAVEGAAVEGAAGTRAGAGMGLEGIAGTAGTALGVLGYVDMGVNLYKTGCLGVFAEQKADGSVEYKPLCPGGEPTVYGEGRKQIFVPATVKEMDPAVAEKTLREGDVFIRKATNYFERDELWQIVGRHAEGMGFFHEWGPFFVKTWPTIISSPLV